MTVRRLAPAARLFASATAAALLAGCISVLPKEKPVQMYRFGGEAQSAPAPIAGSPRIGLVLARVDLPRASAGDRILTVSGEQAAYLAGARWVSPAAVLFEDSVERAFDARSQAVRMLSRGETGASQGALRVEATDFETRYPSPGSPVVRVTVRAMLMRRNGSFVADAAFPAEAPASDNSVRAIVAAYGQAVGQAEQGLVAWTDANAAQVLTPDPALPRPAFTSTTTTSTTTSR